MTSGWLSQIAGGNADPSFQFDRPAEHGLEGRSYGEGSLASAEAREAAVDGIRDAVLAHYDPIRDAGRWAAVEAGAW